MCILNTILLNCDIAKFFLKCSQSSYIHPKKFRSVIPVSDFDHSVNSQLSCGLQCCSAEATLVTVYF